LLILLLVAACRNQEVDATCRCTPENVSLTKSVDEAKPMDGAELVARLRKHRADVSAGKNARAVKIVDDELKLAVMSFCQPCTEWISDRMTIEQMFPLDRLDEATGAVCMGLVLRDGTTAWGDARPRACR
jgi:hypothetical protein